MNAKKHSKFGRIKLAAALLGLTLAGAQVLAGDLKSLTTPQELALGQGFSLAVDSQFPLLRDPVLKWYINLRGRQLADVSPRRDIPYFFRVIDSGEINAFAIPGGHIYLNLGIWQVADNEAELLGIVAHEIGHVVGRHGAKQIVKQQWASIALTSAARAHRNYYAHLAGNLFGQLGFLKMNRDAEREADSLGFQIMVAAGYHPQAMIAMFEKMQERHRREPGRLEKLFLTHPPTDERIANLKAQLASATLPDGLRVGTEEFEEITQRVTELYPYHPPDEAGDQEADEQGEKETAASETEPPDEEVKTKKPVNEL